MIATMSQADVWRGLSLFELIGRIVAGDRDALAEFHDHRTIFDKRGLLLVEFLRFKRDVESRHNWGQLADAAFDCALDRFCNIPEEGEKAVDCRKYFAAALQALASEQSSTELQMETALIRIMNRLVSRHFELSLKELRRSGERTRYKWKIPGGAVTVLMPRRLAATERRVWLEKNIPNPCARHGEKERIQTLIDERLGKSQFVPLIDNLNPLDALKESDRSSYFTSSLCDGKFHERVAREKADRVDEQRRAIRELGAVKVQALVLHIFEGVCSGEFDQKATAQQFGLSTVALSRFAARSWKDKMPALWRNVAQAAATSEDLIEAAKDLGIWKRLTLIAGIK